MLALCTLTRRSTSIYSWPAMANTETSIQEQDLRALEVRVEELIRACTHLKDENKTLRAELEMLSLERDKLLENNATARMRMESLIDRLKTLEIES